MTHSWLSADGGTVLTWEEPVTRAQEAFERRAMAAKARADSWGCLPPEEEAAFAEEALRRGLDDSIVWMVERLPIA